MTQDMDWDEVPEHWEPLPPCPTASEAKAAAAAALEVLDPLGADGHNVARLDLIELTRPLIGHRQLGVRCANPICHQGLGFVALRPDSVYIESFNKRSKPKQRHGGSYDGANHSDYLNDRNVLPWVKDGQLGKGTVRATGDREGLWSGLDERRRFICSKCGAEPVLTNTQLLRQYLQAIVDGQREFLIN